MSDIDKIKKIFKNSKNNVHNRVETFNTPEFLSLQKRWYQKLKAKNFVDIEQTLEKSALTRSFTPFLSPDKAKYTKKDRISLEIYYNMCTSYLHKTNWDHYRSFLTWELYSQGQTYRQIRTELRKRNYRKNTSLWAIHKFINHHISLMKSLEGLDS